MSNNAQYIQLANLLEPKTHFTNGGLVRKINTLNCCFGHKLDSNNIRYLHFIKKIM